MNRRRTCLPCYRIRCLALLAGTALSVWIVPAAAQAQGTAAANPPPAPSDPVPFEAVQPGPPAAPPSPVSRSAAPLPEELPDLTAISTWEIPPVRWGGNTASTYNWNESSGIRSYNETQSANLRASSYIYQPWYAQVSGDVGLLTGTAKQNGGDAPSSTARNTSLTYGGNLSLFPQSRFPFQAYLQNSDSRANASATSAQYTALRYGALQNYRPETGPENYSASADRSIVESGGIRSVVDALQGTFATTLADHSLSANARYSRNSGDVAGQGSQLMSFGGTHSWRADEDLAVASSANYTKNQIRMLTPAGLSLNNSQIVQAGSSVTWLPDEDLPLTIVGGGNFLHMTTETELAQVRLTNLNGYANANYRISDQLTANGGVTLAHSQNNGVSQFASAQTGSLSYMGTPLVFGDYSYNWGTGASISNQVISGGASSRSISANAQHSLLRNIVLSDASTVVVTASQSYSHGQNSISGQSGVLTHSGGASWRLGFGERTLGSLGFTASDSLSTGSFASHYRNFSALGNMQTQLTARSALVANLNMIYTQQLTTPQITQTATPGATPVSTVGAGTNTLTGNGQISYTHRSPFDIANLLYTASFQANASQTNLRLVTNDPNAMTWQTGRVFQHNADYRLGRLVFRGTASFATFNGKKNASLFFMISREIGDF